MRKLTVLGLVLVFAAWPATAYAYVDPAAGGLVLQFILGGVAGVLVVLRLTWHRIKSLIPFGKKSGEKRQD